MPIQPRLLLPALLLAAVLGGCGEDAAVNPADQVRTPGPAAAPDFSLIDVNPTSPSFDQPVSPRRHIGRVSVWYFGHATCSYCQDQFGQLNTMQGELGAENLDIDVQILGVNAVGHEEYNSEMCSGRDLPWLQDTVGVAAWAAWNMKYRDLVILDAANELVDIDNLTTLDLAEAENYAVLKARIRAAAGRTTP